MKVRVLFFAILKEKMKQAEGDYEALEGETVVALAKRLVAPACGDYPFEKSLLFAVNNQYVDPDYCIQEGDEIALIPPVAGG